MKSRYYNRSNDFQFKESNRRKIDYCHKVLKKLKNMVNPDHFNGAEKILTLLEDADIRLELLELHIHRAYVYVHTWADSHIFNIRINDKSAGLDSLNFWPSDHKYDLKTEKCASNGWVYFNYSEFKKLADNE